jgi:hypothetical protein
MPSANESIEPKYHRFLEHYDPRQAAKLDGTFMNHLAAAIRASSPNERQQALDKAIVAYENAVDDVLYDI